MKKKLSILLAGVCLTAALIQRRHNLRTKQNQLRQAERRHSHNKQIPRRNDQRQSQRKSDKTTGQRTKKRTLR